MILFDSPYSVNLVTNQKKDNSPHRWFGFNCNSDHTELSKAATEFTEESGRRFLCVKAGTISFFPAGTFWQTINALDSESNRHRQVVSAIAQSA